MKAVTSWQTLQILVNPHLRGKAWDVVGVPLKSANCLQSYLICSSCWSRCEMMERRPEHFMPMEEGKWSLNISSCSQAASFLHLSGDLALYDIATIACWCPNIYFQEPTELQCSPGTAFKVFLKGMEWGVSLFELRLILCCLKFIISHYLNRGRNQRVV